MADLTERMKAAKERVDELKSQRSRLSGELETHEKRVKELEDRCVEEFGIDVSALEGKIKDSEAKAEALLADAEKALFANSTNDDDEESE